MGHKRHQKYWQRFLLADEKLIHTFSISGYYLTFFWIVPAVFLLVLSIYLYFFINIMLSILAGSILIIMLFPIVYMRFFVHYSITDQRLMAREGILYKKFITADLPSITDIMVHEKLLERLFTRTGSIGINTAGSDIVELHFNHIRKPAQYRSDIYKHQNIWRSKHGNMHAGTVQQANRG